MKEWTIARFLDSSFLKSYAGLEILGIMPLRVVISYVNRGALLPSGMWLQTRRSCDLFNLKLRVANSHLFESSRIYNTPLSGTAHTHECATVCISTVSDSDLPFGSRRNLHDCPNLLWHCSLFLKTTQLPVCTAYYTGTQCLLPFTAAVPSSCEGGAAKPSFETSNHSFGSQLLVNTVPNQHPGSGSPVLWAPKALVASGRGLCLKKLERLEVSQRLACTPFTPRGTSSVIVCVASLIRESTNSLGLQRNPHSRSVKYGANFD